MRIIAGVARGRTLIAPKGMDTRPTLDRVRESLFSILQPRLGGAQVLDLFAGSGALGLEAISRGARGCVLVDQARAAQEAIRHNVAATRFEATARLLCRAWPQALRQLEDEGARFDLIFLDPPYRMPQAADMLLALRDGPLLAPDACVVYEHGRDLPPDTVGWRVADTRHYGDTTITFLTLPDAGGDEEGDAHAHSAIPGQL